MFSQTYVEQTGMRNSGTGLGYKGATSYILTQCNNRHSFLCKIQRCLTSKANSVSLHCVCTARWLGDQILLMPKWLAVFENGRKRYGNTIRSCGKSGRYCTSVVVASFRLSVSSSSRKKTGRKDSVPLFSFFEP